MLKFIKIFIFLYFIVYPLGTLGRFGGYDGFIKAPGVNFYITDILVGLIYGLWLIRKLINKEKFAAPKLTKPILAFAFISALSLLVNSFRLKSDEVLISILYWTRWVAYAGLYFVLSDKKLNRFKKSGRVSLKKILLVLGSVTAIFGLVQYFVWPNIKPLEVYGWDPHFYRVVGTFLDPGFTGLILVFTLILITQYWEELGKLTRWGRCCLWVLVYLVLALTYSRSSYLAYLAAMGVIAFYKKSLKFFISILILGIITVLILPRSPGEGGRLSREYSIQARIENWRHSIIIAKDHLLTGVGFNAYRYAQRDYGFLEKEDWLTSHSGAGADSSLLFVFATTGIFGLTAYLWIWKKALCTRNKGNRGVILASATAVFAHSIFLNSLFYPWVMAWLWILLSDQKVKEKR